MSLTRLTIDEYAELLGSDRPSPGGGSAAALLAALGASLAEMTCRLNAKRKKTNPAFEQSLSSAQMLAGIRVSLLKLVTEDAEIFEKIMTHWKNKTAELQGLLKEGSGVPLEITRLASQALDLAQTEIPRTSRHLMSDLSEAGIVLDSALKAARLNVEINLKSLEDKIFIKEKRSALRKEMDKCRPQIQELIQAFEKE